MFTEMGFRVCVATSRHTLAAYLTKNKSSHCMLQNPNILSMLMFCNAPFLPMTRMTFGRGLEGSNTSYSSMSSAVSDRSESLSMENWLMGGRRSYRLYGKLGLSGNTVAERQE